MFLLVAFGTTPPCSVVMMTQCKSRSDTATGRYFPARSQRTWQATQTVEPTTDDSLMVTFKLLPIHAIERYTMSRGKDRDARRPPRQRVHAVAYKFVAILEIRYGGGPSAG